MSEVAAEQNGVMRIFTDQLNAHISKIFMSLFVGEIAFIILNYDINNHQNSRTI